MNPGLLDMFNATLGGPTIPLASAYLGESEDSTWMAARSVGAALLAGLMQRVSSPAGVGEIFRAVTDDSVDAGIGGKLGGMLANRDALDSLLANGEATSGMVFGSRAAAVTNAIADANGMRPNSAMALLSLGAPLLLGMLKKHVGNNDLDAPALASLISRQKGALARNDLDYRIARALGFDNLNDLLASLPGKAVSVSPSQPLRDKGWMPWAVAAGVATLGVLFFATRTAEFQGVPGEVRIAQLPGQQERLRLAVADSTKVYFDADDARIDLEDRDRIASAAQSAREAERFVTVTGYAGRPGGQDLARNRAQAVRDELVREGVNEDRIIIDPPRPATDTGADEPARVDIDVR